ncbi:MAG TPA: hypothetical protein GXX28_12550 [Firmicutes bacterium]|nr:hypothetical protein [Bacillota bacterium]
MADCMTCARLALGRLIPATMIDPADREDDTCSAGHDPDDPPEDCEDYEPGCPMTAEEYAREAAWMYDERV